MKPKHKPGSWDVCCVPSLAPVGPPLGDSGSASVFIQVGPLGLVCLLQGELPAMVR